VNEATAKLCVLVVEDEPLIGMEIEDVIELLGQKVIGPAAELNQALDLATNALIECAILDINIRGGASYPVAFTLLDRGVPILLATGYGEHTLPERLRGEARLTKPFTTGQLDEKLRKLFARAMICRGQEPTEQV